jgi:hypothetical protein
MHLVAKGMDRAEAIKELRLKMAELADSLASLIEEVLDLYPTRGMPVLYGYSAGGRWPIC